MLALGVVLTAAIVGLGIVFNHSIARMAFVEAALTNGLAPAAEPVLVGVVMSGRPFDAAEAASDLSATAISVFVSSTCVTCVRLVDDLADPAVDLTTELHLYFETDAPMVARRGEIHERQREFIERLRVPALPYVVITVDGSPVAHGAVPDTARLDSLMALAGLSDRLPKHLTEPV